MTQVCVFEDTLYKNLFPLTATRPAYLLRSGLKDLLGKILDYVPEADVVLHCRKELENLVKSNTAYSVNTLDNKEDTIFINGRILADDNFVANLKPTSKKEKMLTYNEQPLIIRLNQKNMKHFKLPELFDKKTFKNFKLDEASVEINTMNFFWDFIQYNAKEITIDSKKTALLGKHNSDTSQARMLNAHNIFIGEKVVLKPGVVLDATDGPIFIDNQAEILPNAVLMGPVYIGFKAKIKTGAKLYGGTSIGPVCKVGGELETVIFQGYSNKQHDGFLGHSFIGEWVNLGAGTENSDLKNNYQEVEVKLAPERSVRTHLQLVGCCLGDHVKTGIQTIINTGSVFGPFCNLFGSGYQPKYLPAFTWQNNDIPLAAEYNVEKALQTAKAVMLRRGLHLSKDQEKLYNKIYEDTARERKDLKIK